MLYLLNPISFRIPWRNSLCLLENTGSGRYKRRSLRRRLECYGRLKRGPFFSAGWIGTSMRVKYKKMTAEPTLLFGYGYY